VVDGAFAAAARYTDSVSALEPLQPGADPAVPERIGAYEVLLPIGTGGMATVYLARKPVVEGVERDFALKLMHAHLRGDPEWASHLVHEARLAARVRHPNVVQVVEVGDDPLGVFIVLDYIEGDTLSGLSQALHARNRALPLAIAGRILIDALTGLHAAHELRDESGSPLGIVHRDFTPQNILVGVDGVARLTDFGIAKSARGGNATATGVLKGKVRYMSPEQARGRQVDRRCDVWAAGVIAWELLAGRRLHANRGEADTLLAVVSEAPPPLERLVPGFPPALGATVASALTLDADRRCPDARRLAERLEAAWTDHAGLARTTDVADFVKDAVADRLSRRKLRIDSVLAQRAGAAPAESADTTTSTSGQDGAAVTFVVGGPGGSLPNDGPASPGTTTLARRRRRVFAVGTASAAVLSVVVAALALARGGGGSAAPSPPDLSAAPPEAAPASGESPPPPPDEPSARPPDPPPNASLRVRADRPIKRLRIGRRIVDVAVPVVAVEVPLLPDEFGKPLVLEATAESGATAQTDVGEHDGTVSIRFPGGARPPPSRKPKGDGDLAPTPFK